MPIPLNPVMTSEQIERCIDAAIPELRTAIKTMIENQEGIHIFDIWSGRNSKTGIESKMVCFIAVDELALVLEGAAKGIGESQKLQMDRLKQLAMGR